MVDEKIKNSTKIVSFFFNKNCWNFKRTLGSNKYWEKCELDWCSDARPSVISILKALPQLSFSLNNKCGLALSGKMLVAWLHLALMDDCTSNELQMLII